MRYLGKSLFMFSILLLLFVALGFGEDVARRVAVFPFQINAPEDLSYMREGIMDMLSSRLAWEGKVVVIQKQLVKEALSGYDKPISEATAREVGVNLQADYVLFGSLTVFRESVSIDAKMLALKEDKLPVTVYAQTREMSEVIPRIHDFAQDINNKIFGRGGTVVVEAPEEQRFSQKHPESLLTTPGAPLVAETPEEQRFSQKHPESLLTSLGVPAVSRPEDRSSLVDLQSGKKTDSDLYHSQKLEFQINSMDVGDLDGDGHPEIVVLSEFKEAIVYKWDQRKLTKRTSFAGSARDRLIWVCLVDANHNGRPEIYISSLRGQRLSSYALEWRRDQLEEIASGLQWYFNRLTVPGKYTMLMGQKKNTKDIFVPGIFRLQYAGGRYQSLEGISVPPLVNIFDFAQGDLDEDGKPETVFIGTNERLGERLYLVDHDGTRLWKSKEYYGATSNVIEGKAAITTTAGPAATAAEVPEKYYIPSPLLLVDLNNDKRPEILATRNVSTTTRILSGIRNFSDGEIQSLFWTGDDLLTQWKTRPLRGMVVSYCLADMDGDGQEELIAAVVLEKQIFKETKSMIYVWELDQVKALSGRVTTPSIIGPGE